MGNPYQTSWGEADDKKGFHVYDVTDNKLEFIQNPSETYQPVFYDDNREYNFDVFLNKIVRVFYNKQKVTANFEVFLDKLEKKCYSYDLEDLSETVQVDLSETYVVSDTTEILKSWLSSVSVDINKNMLDDMVFGIYREAVEGGSLLC